MEHEGNALAADETDSHHHRNPGIASVHVRAVITWYAIFPLVALGIAAMNPFTQEWHPVLRTFVLTLAVVPLAVYLIVPRLLLAYSRLSNAIHERRLRRAQRRNTTAP
jgi:antibiotic biosynthesis monooxygenase (ABM) superfamily enzyme